MIKPIEKKKKKEINVKKRIGFKFLFLTWTTKSCQKL